MMKEELLLLYEGTCMREPSVFETPELQEQLDHVFSLFEKYCAEYEQATFLELCENWQKNAFAVGFRTAVNLLTR